MGGLDDGRMIGKTQIVIGAEVDDLTSANVDGRALRPLKLAFALVETLGPQVVQHRPQHVTQMGVAHGDPPVCRHYRAPGVEVQPAMPARDTESRGRPSTPEL